MRKQSVLWLGLCLVHCLLNSACLFADKPNILWIMSEDNSKHYLKMFDPSGAATPNIEALANQGVAFDRAFSCGAVCSVARTTLITGIYAPRLGTQFHRRIALAEMPEGWEMFPALLRKAGYYTTNNSKKDYNAVEGDGVWDESSNKAHWRNRLTGQPFFHVQTFTDSHESSLHFKQDWVDNPNHQTATNALQLAPYHPDTELFRLTYARYHDRIKIIDEKVGDLVAQLDSDGELENTFIFYFGDHGGVLPRGKGYLYESGLHVPLVVRTPENWQPYSPFPRGSRTSGFVEFVDFAPTVLTLAGVAVPDYIDGKAFLGPSVTAEDVNARNETFGYVDRMDEKYDLCRSLRIDDWKYIRNFQAIYPDGLQNNYRYEMLAYQQWRELFLVGKLDAAQRQFFESKTPEMLFDLSKDPYEVHNLAGQSEYEPQLKKMRNVLSNRMKALPDLSMIPESDLVDDALNDPITFGRRNRDRIANLIDVANLAVNSFDQSQSDLSLAIESDDPAAKYWAFCDCCIFGDQAAPFYNAARSAIASDPNLLVKLKAAEFLGVTKQADPMPVIEQILSRSDSPTVNLIALQSLVHFRDGSFGYDTAFDSSSVKAVNAEVIRRLAYLDGLSPNETRRMLRRKTR